MIIKPTLNIDTFLSIGGVTRVKLLYIRFVRKAKIRRMK